MKAQTQNTAFNKFKLLNMPYPLPFLTVLHIGNFPSLKELFFHSSCINKKKGEKDPGPLAKTRYLWFF